MLPPPPPKKIEQASVQPSLLKHSVAQLILVLFKSFPFGNFAKTRFEPSWAIFWSLSGYKVLKLTTKPSSDADAKY